MVTRGDKVGNFHGELGTESGDHNDIVANDRDKKLTYDLQELSG